MSDKKSYDYHKEYKQVLIFCMVCAFLVGMAFEWIILRADINELGQAICDQEFNMDYTSYNTEGGLVCHPKTISKNYDGIKILKDEGEK